MFRLKVKDLIEKYGVKQEYIIDLIGSNRVTFKKKLEKDGFEEIEKAKIIAKYGGLL